MPVIWFYLFKLHIHFSYIFYIASIANFLVFCILVRLIYDFKTNGIFNCLLHCTANFRCQSFVMSGASQLP